MRNFFNKKGSVYLLIKLFALSFFKTKKNPFTPRVSYGSIKFSSYSWAPGLLVNKVLILLRHSWKWKSKNINNSHTNQPFNRHVPMVLMQYLLYLALYQSCSSPAAPSSWPGDERIPCTTQSFVPHVLRNAELKSILFLGSAAGNKSVFIYTNMKNPTKIYSCNL